MLEKKVRAESKKSSKPQAKKPSPPPLLKKVEQVKEPLTENELTQIQAKHEATEKALELLHERFPNAFRKEDFKPLLVSGNELYVHLKDVLSKSLVTRALKKYFRQEDYQKSVLEGRYFYNLSGEVACEIKQKYKDLAHERLKRFEKRKAKQSSDLPSSLG
jgi:sRNA-binding protein